MINVTFGCLENYDIFVAGDFCPYSESSAETLVVDDELTEYLSRAQLRSVNLECPITTASDKIPKSGPSLKAPLSSAKLLNKLKIDICNLANNHILDYSATGITETIRVLQKNYIGYFGLSEEGTDGSVVKKLGDKMIAFISFTENEFSTIPINGISAMPLDYARQMQQIKRAKANSDIIVVQYHGGAELYQYPPPSQKKYAHFLADLGADIVICHHSHCISGYETYNGVPIFYGLGNFYFPEEGNPAPWYSGFALSIAFGSEIQIGIIPVNYTLKTNTLEASKPPYDNWISQIRQINAIIESDDKLHEAWQEFCQKYEYATLKAFFEPTLIERALVKTGIMKSRLPKRVSYRLVNMIRCESHREKVLTTMKRLLSL